MRLNKEEIIYEKRSITNSLRKKIETLEKSESYKNEQSLIRSVEEFLSKYGRAKTKLITFLSDGAVTMAFKKPAKPKTARKQRKSKIYKTPLLTK